MPQLDTPEKTSRAVVGYLASLHVKHCNYCGELPGRDKNGKSELGLSVCS